MKPLDILVTGASGLLGASLVPYLRAQCLEVETHARQSAADWNSDLASPETTTLLARVQPKCIIHLAAATNVDACEKDRQSAFRDNVRATERLAAWCLGSGAKLVMVSTDQVYDGTGPQGEEQIAPGNVYAWTKLAAEGVTLAAGGTALRTNFFGVSAVAGRPSLSDWVVKSLREKAKISLFTDILFSPLSLPTLCREITRVATKPLAGVFNLGSRDGMSKHDFAVHFAERLGLSLDRATAADSASARLFAYRPKDMRMRVNLYETQYATALPTLRQEIEATGDQYENQH